MATTMVTPSFVFPAGHSGLPAAYYHVGAPIAAPAVGTASVVHFGMPYVVNVQFPTTHTSPRLLAREVAPQASVADLGASRGNLTLRAGNEQESDRLEKMTAKHADTLLGSGTDHVRLVSLGCMCGTKLSFQQLGRGAETLPFDWTRTRMKGILHFLRNDFEGFYDYNTMKPNCGNMTMYRSQHHSFWHDNPDDEGMREKYTRRINRFKQIDASTEPMLFVRAVASSDDLKCAEELLSELTLKFGESTHLLLIVDFQKTLQGPVIVQNVTGNLLLYFHRHEDREPAFAPYMKPVREGLYWAAGKSIKARRFGNMQEVMQSTNTTHWGYTAHGGVRSFEEQPPAMPHAQPRVVTAFPNNQFVSAGPGSPLVFMAQ